MTTKKKRASASQAGRNGYKAYLRKTTKKQRSEWARKAAKARWKKVRAAKKKV